MSGRSCDGAGLTAALALAVALALVTAGECQTAAPITVPCSTYRSCDSCVPHAKCLWCLTTNNCSDYPVSWLLPPPSLCPLAEARWGVCWLNFEALIITLGVLGGFILISITVCCCYCCCCRRTRSSRSDRDEERMARRREEIRQRSEERKVERKTRHDEIRRKYGLIGDADHPYSKFENE
ncbi:hypothetical protein OJAV_G00154210 [Oryzias javanicus]|uniref:PSI domain-containing protein n=1 Tax=Oryzias javanicus TaxID=123683 RepID=A0A3S2M8I5_ORYJA|nr:hypothetical protein OJAV_G00154210 [Oryzias javanicus]